MIRWIRPSILFILLIIVSLYAKNFFVGLFFYPDKINYSSPALFQRPFEDVYFPSKNGDRLHGFFFQPLSAPKGTVLHCHGNAANITNHFPLILFLVDAGYAVLTFDYSGYGQSEGSPSPGQLVDDTLGAISYVRSREDVKNLPLALFGQSLGGAPASEAAIQSENISCLILESTFTTYRDMARATAIGKMLFFLVPFVIPDVGPAKSLLKPHTFPVLVVHGDEDSIIPDQFSNDLIKVIPEPKEFKLLAGFHHLDGPDEDPDYAATLLTFLNRHMKK